MTATNHALTGTAIGVIIGRPEFALPLALISHYVCDAIPHFGFNNAPKVMKTRLFRNYLIGEALICGFIVLVLAILQPAHWQLAAVCAFVAASPDLLSFNRYISAVKKRKWKPSLYSKFAHNIQWFERPIGAVIEITWAIGLLILIRPFLP